MVFWFVTIALAFGVALLLGRAALHGGAGATGPAAQFDIQVYRDQLSEVDRDMARGVIPPAEAERLRTEISRRVLSADSAMRSTRHTFDGPLQPATGGVRLVTVALAGVLFLAALGLYVWMGAPGYPDLPRTARIDAAKVALESRPTQAQAESRMDGPVTVPGLNPSDDYADLMGKLRATVADRPDDIRGFRLLAQNEATLGNFKAGYEAQGRVIKLADGTATGQDYADYADMMILSAGGLISAQASDALQAALQRDPSNGTATYYTGLLMAQTGRPDIAFRLWDGLLRRSDEDAPWVPPIRSQIDQVAQRAGQPRYTQPTPPEMLSGPSAADIDAAGDLSVEQRQQMVQGMVDSLSSRLASQGGSVQEWARLISALGVLEETARARAIYEESVQVFAGQTSALATLAAAANQAGIAE
ncbi:c-type cytochrome biogenesis protein CcmI [Pseudooceanicola sediminis]|uniref:C-type cytochrome biogenesis protein CcmI n=1 Tax=Pseudooceanicola sediminis TaxID=2211117 RepID=A0A399J290_9RHOB|nr:c-type cytochrome biogenesis protein CcmI [Pseudooceanicola sediminis]KAA2312719.1 c-type cytochrome biogenesis protein CcmI [Puniceibacterium sp. HSS470]RII38012.1 c-type cytochrome biogenesis protein CcmI [Pseudooceanicola sediminis]|tara:strand:- start:24579 stop:25832 length:1254 start_codon:yes stop_codon:yes gene_type:complete